MCVLWLNWFLGNECPICGVILEKEGIMKSIKMLLLFLLILPMFLTDCTRMETIKYDETERAPKSEDYEMKVYTESGVPKEHTVIGEVRVVSNSGNQEIIKKLKSEAKKIGADAIVNMRQVESSDGIRQVWKAKAIVWTDKESD